MNMITMTWRLIIIVFYNCRLILAKSLMVKILSSEGIMISTISIISHFSTIELISSKILCLIWMVLCSYSIIYEQPRIHYAIILLWCCLSRKTNNLQRRNLERLLMLVLNDWPLYSLIPICFSFQLNWIFWLFFGRHYTGRASKIVIEWYNFLRFWLTTIVIRFDYETFTDLWVFLNSFRFWLIQRFCLLIL